MQNRIDQGIQSSLDVEHLDAKQNFDELPITYVIFITETDIFGENKPLYRIERINIDTNKAFEDGEHILYVNASYKDESTPLGKLLHDFMCSDPNEMQTPEMAERTRIFKETPKGVSYMCEIIENLQKESALEKAVEIALNLFKMGYTSLNFVSAATKLSVDTVKQLAIDNNIAYTM